MGKSKRFKSPSATKGSRIKASEQVDYNSMPPLFSLEKVQSGSYCLSSLDQQNKAHFAEAIFKRKNLSWQELIQTNRHGLGIEKLPVSSVKEPVPRFITDEVKHFEVFRYHDRKAMVGYRQKNVFYVLWFDHNFTLYNHG